MIGQKTPFQIPMPTEEQIDKTADLRLLDTWIAQYLMGWDDCDYKALLKMAVGIPPERKDEPRDYRRGVQKSTIPEFTANVDSLIDNILTILQNNLIQEANQIALHIKSKTGNIHSVCDFNGKVVSASGKKAGEAFGKLLLKLIVLRNG